MFICLWDEYIRYLFKLKKKSFVIVFVIVEISGRMDNKIIV